MRILACFLLTASIGLSGCTPAAVVPPGQPQKTPKAAKRYQPKKLLDVFLAQVERIGLELPYRPEMIDWAHPNLTSFAEEARTVGVPVYEPANPGFRELLDSCGGREFFEYAFRWFFPFHELAHFLQIEFGWKGDRAAAERQACDLAVAFHLGQPDGRERLLKFKILVEKAVAAFPDPTPRGVDPHQYFNSHYQQLRRDPMKFVAYQWRFVLDSMERAEQLDFQVLASEIMRQNAVPTAVVLDAGRDAGFHVAAHLNLPDVAFCLHDPRYVEEVSAVRRQYAVPDLLLSTQVGHLSRELNRHENLHRLVRVPALFVDFADTKEAFDLLLRQSPLNDGNRHIQERLRTHFLSRYPDLERLSGWKHDLARELAAVIEYEYESFHRPSHRAHSQKWDWARRKFRDVWYREVVPTLADLNRDRRLRQVVIVLSPALRRQGVDFGIQDGIGRVAVLLPQNPQEMKRSVSQALLYLRQGLLSPSGR